MSKTQHKALPSLNAIRHFEAASRHLNFTLAAQELHVTPGAVSRSIALLEEQLHTRLFERSGRRLNLTSQGERYLLHVQQAFGLLRSGTDEIRQQQQQQVNLALAVLPSFAQFVLVPLLAEFHQANPGFRIHLQFITNDYSQSESAPELELAQQHPDAFIHSTMLPPPYENSLLMQEELVVVAHSQWAEHSFASVPKIQHSTRPQSWQQWGQANGLVIDPMAFSFFAEHFFLVIELALNGCGAALVPKQFVAQQLATGQLISPWGQEVTGRQYRLSVPPLNLSYPPVHHFREFLLSKV